MLSFFQKPKIIVGMSGGVDSSVTALLLQQQGYEVHGVFMQNWEEDGQDPYCNANEDLQDVLSICERLNIPLQKICFTAEYWEKVFKLFLDGYAAGYTPNPDILCNKEIKFKAFLDYAIAHGADFIATGHYARIHQENGRHQLLKGLDASKDQSYFLYTLQQSQLAHSLFPLGALEKKTVRLMANTAQFKNHAKKDSTGICFIGERKFKDFLSEYLLARPGPIETMEGKIIGQHQGLMFYTLGQRQGLGIGGQRDTQNMPWYVLDKDMKRNVLLVGQSHDHPRLFKRQLICHQLSWVNGAPPPMPLSTTAKTRYRQTESHCIVQQITQDQCEVTFEQPQWAITPGQSVVFYQGEVCLGGGVII